MKHRYTSLRSLSRAWLVVASCVALAACEATSAPADATSFDAHALEDAGASLVSFARTPLGGDLAEYSVILALGPGPDQRIGLHRVVRELAPYLPRPAARAVMLVHGDFSSFRSSFLLDSNAAERTLAGYLAAAGIDVWGVDRRWALLDSGSDPASASGQGLSVALDDLEVALGLARAVRRLSGAADGRLTLVGFSRGAHIAYLYAGRESQRPASARHVAALVPMDAYARIAPDDEAARASACLRAEDEASQLAAGIAAADNSLFPFLAALATSDPDGPSPIVPEASNRTTLLTVLAQTYFFFDPTSWYHLMGGNFTGEEVTDLAYSPFDSAVAWFARATPYQAMAELEESDALWCGQGALPLVDHLEDIRVPLFYIGAAGGFGEAGRHSTTLVGSSDVTVTMVRRRVPGEETLDMGHADLLHARDAAELVWQPLLAWLSRR